MTQQIKSSYYTLAFCCDFCDIYINFVLITDTYTHTLRIFFLQTQQLMADVDGETPLSAYVKMLLDKIVSSDFLNNFKSKKLDVSLLKNLKSTLLMLQVVLHYAEKKQIIDPTVKELFYYLRLALFEVAKLFDQMDLFRYQTQTAIDQVLHNIPSLFKRLNSEMQSLIEILDCLSSEEQLGSSILVDEYSLYGRDSDIKKMKNLLLSSDCDDDSKIRVISIVGMAGIGKTALAKLLYNDPQVNDQFELKLWADISKDCHDFDDYDGLSVFETIFESVTSQTIINDNSITNRNDTSDVKTVYPKFLLVLDDVWDPKSVNWMLMMDIFNVGKPGSRIIITTRHERVPISMQTFFSVHYLRPLEIEDCWSIVARHASGPNNYQQRSNLEEIGMEIAKKCDGLPLAAVALGNFLHTKFYPDGWNYVLESDILELGDHTLNSSLHSSYHYLSIPLKQCFEYCSIFPKKSIFEKKMVVQLWVAEGFVEFSTTQSWEKVGEEYFDELVSRSLIHRRSIDDDEASFEMNNLIHDLATMVSGSNYIRYGRGRHLSYNRELYDSFNKFDKLYGLNDLRSFLALPLQRQLPLCLLSNKVVHDFLPTMKQLRVLSLSNYKSITEVPNSIENLLHLRYLNLSHTKIERLPSEICRLYNLQFLLLAGCRRLVELPEDLGLLVNLLHLDVNDTALREMPVQISKLEKLQILSDFAVSRHNGGLKVGELEKYAHLHGKLSISQLQNVNDPFEAVQANMKMKERVDELALEWDCCSAFSDSQIQSVVLEHLRPSTNLKTLTIKGYGGISFPNWLGDSLFSNMVYLRISNCDDCLWLPPLGQLGNLKELIIEGMQSVQVIGTEFYGSDSSPSFQPFPSLETLHFENMQEWEEWSLIGGTAKEFLSLKTLSLSQCPKLSIRNMPDKFHSSTEPESSECLPLVQSMSSADHVFRQLMFPLNSLRQLTIDGFPSPISFPTDGLPKTLKFLIISNCENLEFLPHEHMDNYTSLEELKISYSCNTMVSFFLGSLPVLKSLFIEGCKNLKSILTAEDASEKSLSFLRSIKIWDCNELESFSPYGLLAPNLVYIAVWKCEKLHSLSEAMNTLTGLQEMEIDNLPNIQSFVIDDLPISLQELSVGSVGGISWNTEPTLEHLNCLSVLRINGGDTVNKFMVPFLPASLVTLCICGFSDTRIDGKWLQHLTSLQNLEIVNAPKLKSLPKKGLPSSLSVLSMTHCPLLESGLRRKRGKKWRKIAHIPFIIIDVELIT